MTAPASTSTEDRALALLGTGIPAESVAAALGVTPGRISQLLSDREFAAQVTTLKYEALSKHNDRDAAYDSLEDTLLKKLGDSVNLLFRPADIAKTLQLINGAKRRGQSTPDQVIEQQTLVNITVPILIKQKFTTNIANQVIQVGDQSLVTMQSGHLLDLVGHTDEVAELTDETGQSS